MSKAPATPLGRHRQLCPAAGVHVSPLQLGAMSIGDAWQARGMGAMDKESSFKLLDAFYEAGGNFIDTACNYQDETSEMFIGEWMETRGIRDQMVIATKVRSDFEPRCAVGMRKAHCALLDSTRPTRSADGQTSSNTRLGQGTT